MKKIKVYLDNCCFNRPFDNQTQIRIALETEAKLFIQSLIVKKRIELVWSFILLYENNSNPYNIRREAIFDFSKHASDNIAANEVIIKTANEIIKSGLKEKDALHIASGIFAKSEYFITTDDKILKYKTDKIKIIGPIEFIKIWENFENE